MKTSFALLSTLLCCSAAMADDAVGELSKHLGEDLPFFALQPPQHLDQQATVETLASLYREAINSVQPKGPVHLMGYSSGGLVAFEVAQQFKSEGRPVALTGLLDTPGQYGVLERGLYEISYMVMNRLLPLHHIIPSKLLRVMRFVVEDQGLKHHLELLKAYRPQPYDGRLVLFAPRISIMRLGIFRRSWASVARQGLDVEWTSGDHENFIREPHCADLAHRINAALAHST